MSTANTTKIQIIPAARDQLFVERETGVTHTAFAEEFRLFNYIKNGDTAGVTQASKDYLHHGLTMGRLSKDSLRHMKYWAVSSIAVAIHYAILGGLDETDAFNLSDIYIRYVDSLTSFDELIPYLSEKALDLTYLVYKSKADAALSPAIRRCIHYIHLRLHTKITVSDLAKECALTQSYLSTLFTKELGINPHAYILKEKLEAAKIMLASGTTYSEVSYHFSFCSESHFITCFKRQFHMTPKEYVTQITHRIPSIQES